MELSSHIKNLLKRNPGVARPILRVIRKSGFNVGTGIELPEALLSYFGINNIFDVGANTGQYAERTRILGYEGKIVSFEPVTAAFYELEKKAENDPRWITRNFGLGDYDGETWINVSENTLHCSMLDPLPRLGKTYPDAIYVAKEQVNVYKIDSIFNDYFEAGDKVLLKIDAQGYEKWVLEGARSSLNIIGLQLELSLIPHYEGALPMIEIVNLLSEKGYTLVWLSPLAHNFKMDYLTEADGMFFRLS